MDHSVPVTCRTGYRTHLLEQVVDGDLLTTLMARRRVACRNTTACHARAENSTFNETIKIKCFQQNIQHNRKEVQHVKLITIMFDIIKHNVK